MTIVNERCASCATSYDRSMVLVIGRWGRKAPPPRMRPRSSMDRATPCRRVRCQFESGRGCQTIISSLGFRALPYVIRSPSPSTGVPRTMKIACLISPAPWSPNGHQCRGGGPWGSVLLTLCASNRLRRIEDGNAGVDLGGRGRRRTGTSRTSCTASAGTGCEGRCSWRC